MHIKGWGHLHTQVRMHPQFLKGRHLQNDTQMNEYFISDNKIKEQTFLNTRNNITNLVMSH